LELFAAALAQVDPEPIDWRLASSREHWVPTELPSDVASKLLQLTQRLHLNYAGVDLVLHRDRYWFLEANPNGEWGWLRATANLPIDEALADFLIGESACTR